MCIVPGSEVRVGNVHAITSRIRPCLTTYGPLSLALPRSRLNRGKFGCTRTRHQLQIQRNVRINFPRRGTRETWNTDYRQRTTERYEPAGNWSSTDNANNVYERKSRGRGISIQGRKIRVNKFLGVEIISNRFTRVATRRASLSRPFHRLGPGYVLNPPTGFTVSLPH